MLIPEEPFKRVKNVGGSSLTYLDKLRVVRDVRRAATNERTTRSFIRQLEPPISGSFLLTRALIWADFLQNSRFGFVRVV